MTITSTLGVTLGAGVPSLTPQEFARDSVILYDHAAMIAERFRRELVPIVTYMKKEGSKLIEKEHAFLGRTELHYLSPRSLGMLLILVRRTRDPLRRMWKLLNPPAKMPILIRRSSNLLKKPPSPCLLMMEILDSQTILK